MMSARAVLAGLKSLPRQHFGLRTASTSATRDMPEVNLLRAWIMFAAGIATYTISQELVSPRTGSFFDYKLRGDIDKQMDAAEHAAVKEGRVSPADPAEFATKGPVKHTWWWRLAHVQKGPEETSAAAMMDAKFKPPTLSRMA